MSKCQNCNGTGKRTCFSCRGRGIRTEWRSMMGKIVVPSSVRCHGCNGTGKIRCSSCRGTGEK